MKDSTPAGWAPWPPNPYYTPQVAPLECMEEIFLPTIRAMAAEGGPSRDVCIFWPDADQGRAQGH